MSFKTNKNYWKLEVIKQNEGEIIALEKGFRGSFEKETLLCSFVRKVK